MFWDNRDKRYQPVDNGQRDKVAGAVIFLLIVQYDSVVRIRFELDLDAEFVIRFQPVHPDVAFAVKGGYLVISLVNLLIAQQPGVVWSADTDKSCAGQVDAGRGHVAGVRKTRAKFLGRCYRNVIGWTIEWTIRRKLSSNCDYDVDNLSNDNRVCERLNIRKLYELLSQDCEFLNQIF